MSPSFSAIFITGRPSYASVNHRRQSFSCRRRTRVERSATARNIRILSVYFSQTSQDSPLPALLPLTVCVVPEQWLLSFSDTLIVRVTYLLLIKRSMYLWKNTKSWGLLFVIVYWGEVYLCFVCCTLAHYQSYSLNFIGELDFSLPSKFQNIAIHVQLAILLSFWDHADSPPGPRRGPSCHICLHTTQSTRLLISMAHFLTSNATHEYIMYRNNGKSVMRADCSLPSKICIYNSPLIVNYTATIRRTPYKQQTNERQRKKKERKNQSNNKQTNKQTQTNKHINKRTNNTTYNHVYQLSIVIK